ncbi:MAG: sugar ABC transporter permease [Caldilineaceae bacterium]|nr:sugar ABC transporter permease [Caldilineaceae bacterium]
MFKQTLPALSPPNRLRTRWRLSQRTQEELVGYLFILPWLMGFLIFTAGAMLFSFGLTFFKADLLTEAKFIGLANITKVVQDPLFYKSLRVTSYYTFFVVPLSIMLGLSIAIGLNQDLPLRPLWRACYYMPSIVSGLAVAILWMWVFNPDIGLINQSLKAIGIKGPRWLFSETWAMPAFVIMGLWSSGSNMLLYLGGLQSIPTPLYEAAKIDGANRWQRFWKITLPLLSPTIFFSLITAIIGSFQVFTQALVMTEGGPNFATLTMVLYLYRKGFQELNFGYASTLAWALTLIILAFTVVTLRSSALWVYYEGELKK